MLSIANEMNDIDAIVMDFDGVFTDNALLLNQDGRESVLCSRSDGLAFDMLRKFCNQNSWDLTYFVLSKRRIQWSRLDAISFY